jgi:Protein of unknown function (DUF3037)
MSGHSDGAGGHHMTEPRALNTATGTEAFQWALIRVVPRVERGECINAGVIVYSKRLRYLGVRIELDEDRLLALAPSVDVAAARAALTAFERACHGGPHADKTISERFNWLTAPRSAMVQPGPVHGGVTASPSAELDRLFDTMVRNLAGLAAARLLAAVPGDPARGRGNRPVCRSA